MPSKTLVILFGLFITILNAQQLTKQQGEPPRDGCQWVCRPTTSSGSDVTKTTTPISGEDVARTTPSSDGGSSSTGNDTTIISGGGGGTGGDSTITTSGNTTGDSTNSSGITSDNGTSSTTPSTNDSISNTTTSSSNSTSSGDDTTPSRTTRDALLTSTESNYPACPCYCKASDGKIHHAGIEKRSHIHRYSSPHVKVVHQQNVKTKLPSPPQNPITPNIEQPSSSSSSAKRNVELSQDGKSLLIHVERPNAVINKMIPINPNSEGGEAKKTIHVETPRGSIEKVVPLNQRSHSHNEQPHNSRSQQIHHHNNERVHSHIEHPHQSKEERALRQQHKHRE